MGNVAPNQENVFMKKMSILLCVFAAFSVAQDVSLLEGKLLGHDGKPMVLANLTLLKTQYDRDPLQSVEADKDGHFSMKIEGFGVYTLLVSGVHHEAEYHKIYVPNGSKIDLKIQLTTIRYLKEISEVQIMGDWNSFNFKTASRMDPASDGTFVFEIPSEETSVGYELLGITEQGNSVNGTQQDSFKFDGGGDYISVVNNSKKIIYDPGKRIISNTAPSFAFGDSDSLAAGMTRALKLQDEQIQVMMKTSRQAFQSNIPPQKALSELNWDDAFKRVQQEKDRVKDQLTKDFLEVITIQIHSYAGTSENEKVVQLAKQVLTQNNAKSPFWELAHPSFLITCAMASPEVMALYDQIIDQHPNQDVRFNAFQSKFFNVSQSEDTALQRTLYEKLVHDFSDLREAEYLIQKFNPDRAIKVGKQVPDFSIASMQDKSVVLSRKAMKGKIYLIDFWATWCGPCVGEMPNLHKAYEMFHPKGFEIISLSFDASPQAVTKFRGGKWKMNWNHGFVEQGFENDLAKAFEVKGIPKPILVSADGTILAEEGELRGERLIMTLDRVLAEKDGAN